MEKDNKNKIVIKPKEEEKKPSTNKRKQPQVDTKVVAKAAIELAIQLLPKMLSVVLEMIEGSDDTIIYYEEDEEDEDID